MKLAPGDYPDADARPTRKSAPETIDRLRHDFGLDKPMMEQYLYWLRNALHGDFGYSFTYQAARL